MKDRGADSRFVEGGKEGLLHGMVEGQPEGLKGRSKGAQQGVRRQREGPPTMKRFDLA